MFKTIINRPISEFKGNILNLGGTKWDLTREHPQIKQQMYNVNVDKDAAPDLVADFCSAEALKSLPDNRFSLVYFSGVPTIKMDMDTALKNAYRVLKPGGVMIFAGDAGTMALPTADLPSSTAKAGFNYAKLWPPGGAHVPTSRDPANPSLLERSPAKIIAFKDKLVDLKEFSKEVPELATIIKHALSYNAGYVFDDKTKYWHNKTTVVPTIEDVAKTIPKPIAPAPQLSANSLESALNNVYPATRVATIAEEDIPANLTHAKDEKSASPAFTTFQEIKSLTHGNLYLMAGNNKPTLIVCENFTEKSIDLMVSTAKAAGLREMAFLPLGTPGAIPAELREYAFNKFAAADIKVPNHQPKAQAAPSMEPPQQGTTAASASSPSFNAK